MSTRTASGSVPSLTAHRRRRQVADETGRPASVKFAQVDYTCLEALSWWGKTTVTETIRAALVDYFDQRLSDPSLPEQIEAARRRHDETLSAITMEDASNIVMPRLLSKERNRPQAKPITIRLGVNFVNKLTAFALVDEEAATLADQIRKAVDLYIANTISVDRATFAAMFEDRKEQGKIGGLIAVRPDSSVKRPRTGTNP